MKFKVKITTNKDREYVYPFIRNIQTDGENIDLYDRSMFKNRHKARNVKSMDVEVLPYFE